MVHKGGIKALSEHFSKFLSWSGADEEEGCFSLTNSTATVSSVKRHRLEYNHWVQEKPKILQYQHEQICSKCINLQACASVPLCALCLPCKPPPPIIHLSTLRPFCLSACLLPCLQGLQSELPGVPTSSKPASSSVTLTPSPASRQWDRLASGGSD